MASEEIEVYDIDDFEGCDTHYITYFRDGGSCDLCNIDEAIDAVRTDPNILLGTVLKHMEFKANATVVLDRIYERLQSEE